ncbi:5-carboxymethyl-2-hydroxymuconate isomerase [Acetobacter nitrogenifigens DSM 23921 = NBRC 105050]|uniref:5-carboxymethyl-2-hydroxymuconate isomerase n=1 Tax=Acetobacter nitrogenifigens DSM 23921 = NBRC 105050 TaxID=1120919 RepID=A0A511XEE6_9PROT|nr:5-carboxymethyl-2-hydroxymuconate Delta-isomerase [Acetobacter nitrogenifigens]GBQ92363.1 5-carboxymethyl-2-hydroxymuconate isomerase [Acetobacter nitrogenifigens DSM 23921 = NBRC 105050]GEN61319.1 5-carboxymethyl-2-hydroxymuconate isomerase [Acetobacter nitrogenifigens DSM 23921 = NBRC 105050]
MPHLSIEYSANLRESVDLTTLCVRLRDAILETGLFEVGAVRVRAFEASAWAVADMLPENAFIDMSFRIGEGRTLDEKKRAGEAIFSTAAMVTGQLLEKSNFALSLEIREIDSRLSWKKNSMHGRLR